MKFIGDFHIHSHYSLATSKQLVPEYLDYWARIKGIKVVGTGDFTHPGWTGELKEKLEPAEPGLFKLKDHYKLHHAINGTIPEDPGIRFILTAEISNIYKKNGVVRKIHNVLFAKDFDTVERIQYQLKSRNFNITSDGRPILGMDARNLLEMTLEASEDIFFVPAHIWTPWFSVLGSKSGFNTIEECFEDLTGHIHAVETGLSSDPPMNWVCSFLDQFTLTANSDAHSPEKLGRNANIFDTEISYDHIIQAMKTANPQTFLGTIDFFPQEGKYHYDGHRKCGIRWNPLQTLENKGICPVCGKRITVGVMHRVAELADRGSPEERQAPSPFHPLIPLKELLSEILKTGSNTQRVSKEYHRLIQKAGNEMALLLDTHPETISNYGNETLAEAIKRMRNREVIINEGYDGDYGNVQTFRKEETFTPNAQNELFDRTPTASTGIEQRSLINFDLEQFRELRNAGISLVRETQPPSGQQTKGFNPEQKQAVQHTYKPALVLAGPGTGKTSVLTHRIAYLLTHHYAHPENILALTFTNKAAREMKDRLGQLLPRDYSVDNLQVSTFHAFGLAVLKEQYPEASFTVIDEEDKQRLLYREGGVSTNKLNTYSREITRLKQQLILHPGSIEDDGLKQVFREYQNTLKRFHLYDMDDLLYVPITLLKTHQTLLQSYRDQYKWMLIDEYQDVNYAQYHLIRMLKPQSDANLYVIGDPNQSIYAFRGANVQFIHSFREDYPQATAYTLKKSYRCTDRILKASDDMIGNHTGKQSMPEGLHKGVRVNVIHHNTDKSEAEFVARKIEEMIGGLRFFSMDSSVTEGEGDKDINSLTDFAILCRTKHQMNVLEKALADHAIPYQLVGETPFYKQEPVKSVIQVLQAIMNDQNDFLKKTVREKTGIHEHTLHQYRKEIKGKTASRALEFLITHHFQEQQNDYTEQFQRLYDLSQYFSTDINRFLEYVTMGVPQDDYNHMSEKVSLMTIHASKGLEFQCVFIPGCEDGLIPYHLFDQLPANMEEEKRLLYVGMTRATKHLFLTHAYKRRMHGQEYTLSRSSFLDPIEQDLINIKKGEPSKKQPPEKQLRLF